MAREAGLLPIDIGPTIETWQMRRKEESLVRFAALVAAAEREKVAAWMTERGYATGHGDTIEDLLKELEWQIREQEREACIDIVAMHGGSVEIEAAIRARDEQ
jgi:hypothetical protein